MPLNYFILIEGNKYLDRASYHSNSLFDQSETLSHAVIVGKGRN